MSPCSGCEAGFACPAVSRRGLATARTPSFVGGTRTSPLVWYSSPVGSLLHSPCCTAMQRPVLRSNVRQADIDQQGAGLETASCQAVGG